MNLFSQNIRGEYIPVELKCKIKLTIDAKNYYTFKRPKNQKLKGKVKIIKEDNITYLNFNHIGSMFADDTIYIQNSGNSMNPYWHFEECDEKYLHFAKRHTAKKSNCYTKFSILTDIMKITETTSGTLNLINKNF